MHDVKVEKMMDAKMKCMAPESRKKKPGKGGKKPSKCPSIEDIAEEVAKEMSGNLTETIELTYFSISLF